MGRGSFLQVDVQFQNHLLWDCPFWTCLCSFGNGYWAVFVGPVTGPPVLCPWPQCQAFVLTALPGLLHFILSLEIRCPESSNFALLRIRFCMFTNTHSGALIGIVLNLLMNLG